MSRVGIWDRTFRTTAVSALAMLAVVSCGAPVDDGGEPNEGVGLDGSDLVTDEGNDMSDDPGNDNGDTNGADPDATDPGEEAPEDNEENGAPGAPIDIPAEIQDQGRPLAEMQAIIEQGIREQCGGELCVQLAVEHSAEDFDECTFIETRPPQRSSVARGSTVVIVAGSLPCPTEPSEGGGSGSEGSGPNQNGGTDSEGQTEPEQEVTEESTADNGS
jgi:hypothetical protein